MKKLKTVLLFVLSTVIAFTAMGCKIGVVDEQKITPGKTQIYIAVYNGGVGTDWIEEQAKIWSAANEIYEVIPIPYRITTKDLVQQINSGNTEYDAYYTAEAGFQESIYNDKLENLMDVAEMKVDGHNGGTILEKIGTRDNYYSEIWSKVATKKGVSS